MRTSFFIIVFISAEDRELLYFRRTKADKMILKLNWPKGQEKAAKWGEFLNFAAFLGRFND